MIVALEPAAFHLADVGGVMAGVQRAQVVHHGEQRISVVLEYPTGRVVVVRRALVDGATVGGHEGRHVQLGRERHEGGYLPVDLGRVLEAFQVETGHYRECLQGELLGGLPVGPAVGALDLGARAQVLGAGETLQAGLQRTGPRHVEADVPEWVDGGGDTRARGAHDVALETAREDLVDDAVAAAVFLLHGVFHAVHAVP